MPNIKRRTLILSIVAIIVLGIYLLLFNPTRTLLSFQKNEEYPLYTMTYYGGYDYLVSTIPHTDEELKKYSEHIPIYDWFELQDNQACSLFTATGGENKVYGRNRDMLQQNTALLLFTDPPDGYASVSLVDLNQFGADPGDDLRSFSLWNRLNLLAAPLLPTEGMNEYGLTIAKADVPIYAMPHDPSKEPMFFRTAMRVVLDHAKTTREAIELLEQYNISFGSSGGHFLIADPSGDSAVVEFYDNKMQVIRNPDPWLVITNFNLGNIDGSSEMPSYPRYKLVDDALRETNGVLNVEETMALLEQASVSGTIWSVAFDMTTRDIDVVLFRQFSNIFHISGDNWLSDE
jgi:hypothetical protein